MPFANPIVETPKLSSNTMQRVVYLVLVILIVVTGTRAAISEGRFIIVT